jgi:hypothetical protein
MGADEAATLLIGEMLQLLHANSGEVIDIRPLGSAIEEARTTTLVITNVLEGIRLINPAGEDIPQRRDHGPLSGRSSSLYGRKCISRSRSGPIAVSFQRTASFPLRH